VDGPDGGGREKARGTAFLVAQLGAYATREFTGRVAALGLTPPQVGLLRIIDAESGINQRVMAQRLGTPPSRLVALVDRLEERGVVRRRRSQSDRRNYELSLTGLGAELLVRLDAVTARHENELCVGLDAAEQTQLHQLLRQMASSLELTPGVYPGHHATTSRDDVTGSDRDR
jgi:DNA-binding MarR family transcriptional regulator